METCCPGEVFTDTISPAHAPLRIGDGLRHNGRRDLSSTCTGTRHTRGGDTWLNFSRKRYIPAVDETVVGVVIEVHAENYKVDICAPSRASLPVLSFAGATKHNRPKLVVGSLVHARVLKTNSATDPLLTCIEDSEQSRGLGVLSGGVVHHFNTEQAHKLLCRRGSDALGALGEIFSFEVIVGLNGRIWVAASSVEDAFLIAKVFAVDVVKC